MNWFELDSIAGFLSLSLLGFAIAFLLQLFLPELALWVIGVSSMIAIALFLLATFE